ncbi:MAG: hypothetical protein LIO97_04405 [Tannerellaceae bacterium]|nr:hypothetical protein [Tannerellaceae bacterium]
MEWPGKPADENPTFSCIAINQQLADMLGLKIIMGKWHTDMEVNKVVINEEATRVMGLSDPVGTTIRLAEIDFETADELDENAILQYQIVGVVKDFHTLSLRSRIPPTLFRQNAPGGKWTDSSGQHHILTCISRARAGGDPKNYSHSSRYPSYVCRYSATNYG